MGLDMFLEKKVYVGANYAHNKVTGSINLKRGDRKVKVNLNKVTTIIEDAGYWRKANQIHAWFVKNIQDGNDNCGTYHVEYETLLELSDLCKRVLNTKDFELLPTDSGFFFGSTGYDEYYLEQLQATIDIIDKLDDGAEYCYSSSW